MQCAATSCRQASQFGWFVTPMASDLSMYSRIDQEFVGIHLAAFALLLVPAPLAYRALKARCKKKAVFAQAPAFSQRRENGLFEPMAGRTRPA